ncbi:hypothetical protein SAMN05428974_2461 [Sphingopyxis sp. YR583]|jgi:hypothetical protein|uniref:hypothetical protein n=1 Tax=Sphingopyxis sp. YR583 TaxID=1881047 RepID=UPI0008A735EC|nr:hypothetical protein [Sphingopyxis sp. YR583]SEH18236.1 hypothetical protein SAMN05428974_2461 [Sphingopyxis sp. YR583]
MDELRILNTTVMPQALDALDSRVLDALATRRRETISLRRAMAVAALVSLGGGVVAGSAFVPDAVAASPLTPFAPDSPLASSTLLNGR